MKNQNHFTTTTASLVKENAHRDPCQPDVVFADYDYKLELESGIPE